MPGSLPQTPPACPECGAGSAREIIWGMPPGPVSDDMVIGGCLVPGDDPWPTWQCRECEHEY